MTSGLDSGARGVLQRWMRRLEGRSLLPALLGFAALFLLYSSLVHNIVQNGDAAVYNQQIDEHALRDRPIHFGYMAIGAVFHALLPLATDRAMNFMALVFGVAGLAATYAIAAHWATRRAGIWAVFFVLCSATYVRAMVMSEVDILSVSLITIAFAFYARARPVVAGLLFGAAMLCTPVTLGMIPLFVFCFPLDERGWLCMLGRQVLRVLYFGLAGLMLYAPWVLANFHEYFWGSRGIFTAPSARWDAFGQLAHGIHFFERDAWGLLPLYLAGVFAVALDRVRWQREQPALAVVLAAVTCALAVDRASDVPVYLPLVPLLAVCAALFLERLSHGVRIAWVLPSLAFASMGIPAYFEVRAEVEKQRALHDTYVEMRVQSQPFSPMLADLPNGFTPHRLFERYTTGHCYGDLAPTPNELRQRLHELATEPPRYVIYFAHSVPRNVELALTERYAIEQRTVNGVHYFALIPRVAARNHPEG